MAFDAALISMDQMKKEILVACFRSVGTQGGQIKRRTMRQRSWRDNQAQGHGTRRRAVLDKYKKEIQPGLPFLHRLTVSIVVQSMPISSTTSLNNSATPAEHYSDRANEHPRTLSKSRGMERVATICPCRTDEKGSRFG